MNFLKELTEKDLGLPVSKRPGKYEVRRAARAVVFDAEGNVALSHIAKGDYWKIPGGGIEEGESIEEGLRREVREEAGVDIEVVGEVGIIIEYRNAWEQLQISYCFVARVVGEKQKPEYDEGEREEGFSSHWMTYRQALAECRKDLSRHPYEARFMGTRDWMFVEASSQYAR